MPPLGFIGKNFPDHFLPVETLLGDDLLMIYSTGAVGLRSVKISELPIGTNEAEVISLVNTDETINAYNAARLGGEVPSYYATANHNHNSSYYTKSEADTLFALANHTHDGYASVIHSHAWSEITSKPTTFTPAAHSHIWADILFPGLSWDEITDKPSTFPPSAHAITSHTASGLISGQFMKATGSSTYTFMAHGLDYADVGAAPEIHFHAWSEISGKPSTFTPSAHGHGWSDIIGFPGVAWTEITDKPSTFAPSSHALTSHTVSGLTNGHFLKATGTTTFGFAAHGLTYTSVGAAPEVHYHAWSDISGKPSTFPPSAHGHSWDDMLGTLSVEGGGTGVNTLASGKILVGNGTGGVLTPTNLHWDNTNGRLGIGTTSPTYPLEVAGVILSKSTSAYLTANATTGEAWVNWFTDAATTGRRNWRIGKTQSMGYSAIQLLSDDLTTALSTPMVWNYDGFVGIGTTSPISPLDIYSTGNNYLTIRGVVEKQQAIAFTDTSQRWAIYKPESSTELRIWAPAPTNDVITFKADGKVGIGVSPSYRLDVYSTDATVSRMYNNQTTQIVVFGSSANSQYSDLILTSNAGNGEIFKCGTGYSGYGGANSLNVYNAGGPIAFHSNTVSNILTLLADGKVGIGITNPSHSLAVSVAEASFYLESTTGTNYSFIDISNTGGSFYIGKERSTTGGLLTGSTAYAAILHATGTYPMQFGTNAGVRMTILSNGNVGVGLTNPSHKFSVSGTANVSGAFTVGSTIVASSSITATDFILSSDARLKENTSLINSYLHDVNYYQFNFIGDKRIRFGVIAQELETIYPSLVTEDENGSKKVSYIDLHSMEIAKLKDRIVELENKLKHYGASA